MASFPDDTFVVTASDAVSGWHIHGLASLLNMLTFGLMDRPDTSHRPP